MKGFTKGGIKMDQPELNSLSDTEIAALIESIYQSHANINLGVPYRRETISLFLKQFNCQRCGACCRGETLSAESGVVLNPTEVQKLAYALAVPRSRFKQDYTYVKNDRRLLRYPCPFNTEGSHSCRIYGQRPVVCRTFPLHSPLAGPDGIYLLVVASLCPEGRRVAAEFLKMRRDMANSLKELGQPEQEKVKQASRDFWEISRQEQLKSDWFKSK
jgi:Fe-S-cluster containining protein